MTTHAPQPYDSHAPLPEWPDSELGRAALAVARGLRAAGHQGYFVGGAVRNWLFGVPNEDIDLVTDARPDRLRAIFRSAHGVGAHFGVMLVRESGHVFEVATFRSEGSYVDRRRPAEVRFGTLEEDVHRRDFTINALYYDPIDRRLIDLVGGRDDLGARRLRTVGDPLRRFDEDALRLIRAVRFAVRYDLELDPGTVAAICSLAGTLAEISIERVAEELIRILTGPHPGRAMHLMSDLGLWAPIIPEIEPMHGCEQPPEFHPEGDVFVHTAMALDQARAAWFDEHGAAPPAALMLGTLLHDVGKPPTFERAEDRIRFPEHQRIGAAMADAIARRLRLSNRLREEAVALVEHHMRFMDVPRMKRSTLRRFLGREDFELHLALHKADCLSSHRKLDNWEFCRAERGAFGAEAREQALLPPPLVTGDDLIELGLKPGPHFGKLLEAVRERQLEGELADKGAALEVVREMIARGER